MNMVKEKKSYLGDKRAIHVAKRRKMNVTNKVKNYLNDKRVTHITGKIKPYKTTSHVTIIKKRNQLPLNSHEKKAIFTKFKPSFEPLLSLALTLLLTYYYTIYFFEKKKHKNTIVILIDANIYNNSCFLFQKHLKL